MWACLKTDEDEHGESERRNEEQQALREPHLRGVARSRRDEERAAAHKAAERHRRELPVPVHRRVDEVGHVAGRGGREHRVTSTAEDEERQAECGEEEGESDWAELGEGLE